LDYENSIALQEIFFEMKAELFKSLDPKEQEFFLLMERLVLEICSLRKAIENVVEYETEHV
jgi:hypothetical protein